MKVFRGFDRIIRSVLERSNVSWFQLPRQFCVLARYRDGGWADIRRSNVNFWGSVGPRENERKWVGVAWNLWGQAKLWILFLAIWYLFEVGVYFRHMHLWRDPHVRESPGSLTPSVFLRHPVKPYKNNQNFQSVESSFTVFFLRKKPRRKKKSSHQDPGISPTHQSVQKQWSEITLRFLSPEGSLLR